MGMMRRAIARDQEDDGKRQSNEQRMTDRFASTLVIAASIIAAVRLAREPEISRPTPKILTAVTDSISLARTILEKILG
jgi:hypothetical protein